jgi:glycosyltransferase involved in cell wall biosynthesis
VSGVVTAGGPGAARATLVVTAKPGARCGVSDYTEKLRTIIGERGLDVRVERLPTWSVRGLLRLWRQGAGRRSVLHVQYPSMNLGKSPAVALAPVLVGGARLYLTLHEFTIFNRVRKYYFLTFALSRATVIFSNEFERRAFEAFFPVRRCRTLVVPIGSNIAVGRPDVPSEAREPTLVYFGQIGPDKGLEDFLAVAERLRAGGERLAVAVIGSPSGPDCPVFREVSARAERLGIRLVLNAEPEQVSDELSRARVALLPFPDGVSEKRGSALACLEHGLAVVTTHSAKTPDWLAAATVPHVSVEATAEAVRALASAEGHRAALAGRDPGALRARTWPSIAERHLALYGVG